MLRTGRLDIPGAVLVALGLGTLTYGLVEGADRGFAEVWWSLVVSALALVAFVLLAVWQAPPWMVVALSAAAGAALGVGGTGRAG